MNLFKNKLFFLLFSIFILLFSTFASAVALPQTNSEAILLMDAQTGQILYQKNQDKELYPASITKIMTAALVLENCNDLSTEITANESALNITEADSSNIETVAGETFTLEQLLYALLMKSANESANVLAEFTAGSVDNFVAMMNKKATELGATHTHFNNPHGLNDSNHYTSAHDMALIMQYALKNENFKKIISTVQYEFGPTNLSESRGTFVTKNKLLNPESPYYFEGTLGGKTGYTSAAGHTFVVSAKREDVQLIAVCMNAESIDGVSQTFVDATNMLNYGFENFKYQTLIEKGTEIKELNVEKAKRNKKLVAVAGSTVKILVPNSDENSCSYEDIFKIADGKESLVAPIKKDDVVGVRTYYINSNEAVHINLVAKDDIAEKGTNIFVWLILFLLKLILFIVVLVAILIIGLVIWLKCHNKRLKIKLKKKPTQKVHKDDTNYFDL